MCPWGSLRIFGISKWKVCIGHLGFLKNLLGFLRNSWGWDSFTWSKYVWMKLNWFKFISYRWTGVSNVKETPTKPCGNSGNSGKEAVLDENICSNGNQGLFLLNQKRNFLIIWISPGAAVEVSAGKCNHKRSTFHVICGNSQALLSYNNVSWLLLTFTFYLLSWSFF